MRHPSATTILVFNWESPLDNDMRVGSSHVFAHNNELGSITPYDRVLVAGTDQPPSDEWTIDPKRHFWLSSFKLESATSESFSIRLLLTYNKLLLREICKEGAWALQQSAISGGEIQALRGQVKVLVPTPMRGTRANDIRSRILGAAARERELGPSRRKASSSWKVGHNPGRKS